MVIEFLGGDLLPPFVASFYPEKKPELKKFRDEQGPALLGKLEKLVASSAVDGKFLCGSDKITLADVAVYIIAEGYIVDNPIVSFDKVPAIKAAYDRALTHAPLAAYVA